MKQDPKMRKVRGRYLCAAEGCEEELSEVAVRNSDPFHSAECARAYHDNPIQKPQRGIAVASSS